MASHHVRAEGNSGLTSWNDSILHAHVTQKVWGGCLKHETLGNYSLPRSRFWEKRCGWSCVQESSILNGQISKNSINFLQVSRQSILVIIYTNSFNIGVHVSVLCSTTALQARRSRVWFPLDPHYGPGVGSASKKIDTSDLPWGGKGGRCIGLTTLLTSFSNRQKILGASTTWSPGSLSRPVHG